jgi:hypothetical protein
MLLYILFKLRNCKIDNFNIKTCSATTFPKSVMLYWPVIQTWDCSNDDLWLSELGLVSSIYNITHLSQFAASTKLLGYSEDSMLTRYPPRSLYFLESRKYNRIYGLQIKLIIISCALPIICWSRETQQHILKHYCPIFWWPWHSSFSICIFHYYGWPNWTFQKPILQFVEFGQSCQPYIW